MTVEAKLLESLSLREATGAGITFDTRVNLAEGIIEDVVLMGRLSNNGTVYTESAMQDAFNAVESSPCYIDHPPGDENERSIRERFGAFEGPYFDAAGNLCAKRFKFNVQNSFARELHWLLKNAPHDIGFSINAKGSGFNKLDGTRVAEKLTKVYSFDLVDKPATTKGIFAIREAIKERQQSFTIREATATMFEQTLMTGVAELMQAMKDGKIDQPGAVKKFKEFLKMLGDTPAETPATPTEEMKVEESYNKAEEDKKDMVAMEGASRSKFSFIKRLADSLRGFQVREQQRQEAERKAAVVAERVKKAETVFAEKKVASGIFTSVFREQLANAKDDTEVDTLIADRLTVFSLREQTIAPPPAPGATDRTPIGLQEQGGKKDYSPDELKALAAKVYG